MTKGEYWKDRILNILEAGLTIAVVDDVPMRCIEADCEKCVRYLYGTEMCGGISKFIEWTLEEYEEPKITIPKDTEIDAPILVSHTGNVWTKRHFAKFDKDDYGNDVVFTFSGGATSWTSAYKVDVARWEYAKLPDENKEEVND